MFAKILISSHIFFFVLDLSRNRLVKISVKAFVNLSNLTSLDISYNKLTALELESMLDAPKLHTLNISGNVQLNLATVQLVFENMTEIRSLAIADIINLPLGVLTPLANLEFLNISGTHLGNDTNQMLEPLKKLKVRLLFSEWSCWFEQALELLEVIL